MAELKKALGLKEVTLYGIGVILGAGIYALIGKGAGLTGNSLWMSFLFGALIASFTGLAYGELSSMFPKEAAEYVYVKKASGNRLLAFLITWVILIAGLAAVATVALGFAGYFVHMFLGNSTDFGSFLFFSFSTEAFVAMGLIMLMSLINYKGIKESTWLNIVLTLIEVGGLLFIIFIGLPSMGSVNYFEMPAGISGLLGAMAVTFFAYIGFEDMANISGEVKGAKKIIPKAIVIALIVTTIIYIFVALSAVSLVPSAELAASEAPLALVAEKGFAGAGGLLSVIALFATANTVLVFLIVQSRMAYGVASDGSLPSWLAKINPGTHTPYLAVFTIMVFSLLFCALSDIQTLAELANFGVFTVFLVVNLAHLTLRYTKPNEKREFRTPINIGRFPVLSFLGAITCLIALSSYVIKLEETGITFVLDNSVLFFIALLVSGIIAFFLMSKKH